MSLNRYARPGKWLFPREDISDRDPIQCVEEIVRDQLLANLSGEVPQEIVQVGGTGSCSGREGGGVRTANCKCVAIVTLLFLIH